MTWSFAAGTYRRPALSTHQPCCCATVFSPLDLTRLLATTCPSEPPRITVSDVPPSLPSTGVGRRPGPTFTCSIAGPASGTSSPGSTTNMAGNKFAKLYYFLLHHVTHTARSAHKWGTVSCCHEHGCAGALHAVSMRVCSVAGAPSGVRGCSKPNVEVSIVPLRRQDALHLIHIIRGTPMEKAIPDPFFCEQTNTRRSPTDT